MKPNYGTHQYLCSPQGPSPVKIKHTSIFRTARTAKPCRRALRCVLLLLFWRWPSAPARPWPRTAADHRSDSRHRQPAHSQGNHPRPPVYPRRRHLRSDLHRARLQLALEHRLLRRPAHRARGHGKGHHSRHLCPRKAEYPRDQLQGPQLGLGLRRPRPLQEGEGRPLGREPVRPLQDQARRDGHQGAAGRARPPVRHHQDRGQDHSAGLGAGELQHQGRPGSEGGPDQVRRQPARQRAWCCAAR